MDGQRHEPECTSQAAMESGGDLNSGGYEVDHGVGHVHREKQGAEWWGLTSGGKLCGARRRPAVVARCTASRAP